MNENDEKTGEKAVTSAIFGERAENEYQDAIEKALIEKQAAEAIRNKFLLSLSGQACTEKPFKHTPMTEYQKMMEQRFPEYDVSAWCPDCWFQDEIRVVEPGLTEGHVRCSVHGEMTASHFHHRTCDMQKEMTSQRLKNQSKAETNTLVDPCAPKYYSQEVVFPKTLIQGVWHPIETAPEGVLVIVGWLNKSTEKPDSFSPRRDMTKHPDMTTFDWMLDGIWQYHDDRVQLADDGTPAGSLMPPSTAPYKYWLQLPPLPLPGGGLLPIA